MSPLTLEWVEKAEGDFATARRELRARNAPNYDAACFHAQQCVEKYLKARLQESGTRSGRTHDLVALMRLALPVEPAWHDMRDDLEALAAYAVHTRYPGASADRTIAREAVTLCSGIRARIRADLGLPPVP
jgi:HEPN domain-containing protein